MTGQRIRIISERLITTTPRPGEIARRIQITYQVAPRPPAVFWVDEGDLPHWVWRRENPTVADLPENVLKAGNAKLRSLIEARDRTAGGPAPRTI
jgi:hypothetical protein